MERPGKRSQRRCIKMQFNLKNSTTEDHETEKLNFSSASSHLAITDSAQKEKEI